VDCCEVHDRSYHWGGDESVRKGADQMLRRCIRQRIGWYRAWVYYTVVRRFGRSHFNYREKS
jgi:hypothetical protein